MSGVEALYPFLYSGAKGGDEALVADVERSTAEKAAEAAALRASLAERFASALVGCAEAVAAALEEGGRLLAFGNGGSATDAQAFTTLLAAPPPPLPPLPALALAQDTAALTALANDVGYEVVFARQIAALGRPGDVAVAFSTSGGSANVLRGLTEAGRRGLVTVGFAGYDGGPMAAPGVVDHLFVVPSSSVHRVQEAQTTLYHVLGTLIRDRLDVSATAPGDDVPDGVGTGGPEAAG
ncbi:SIS domain-containing protein [Actinocorallia sp. API 0066]|uniref:D-sedoheptulose-7-phosphate isomerase n=1 Tax=Actinocorallia sp. API 0066 TaxID=2896846 RepID=UPI001E4FB84A|nr:SIS domain-containing protein [Actinocorallia sp. API 0066]MCD0449900.1 SIS domain-containing protein [Actinocorallia sp. API 0066]